MSEKKEYGAVRHGDNPDEPPLKWFVAKRHGHSSQNTQQCVKWQVDFFLRWLNDELSWIIYKNDDKKTIEKKRRKWGEEILQPESEMNWTTGGDLNPQDLSIDDALDYLQALSECPRFTGGSEEAHANTICQFYDFCLNRGHSWFNSTGNPIELALNEGGDKIIESSSSRTPEIISLDEMGEYIRSFYHPLWETIPALMGKTTVRRGVPHNLDLLDVYLDHPACDWNVHRQLRHKDRPFLFIPSEPEEGKLWEERERVPQSSNKTSVNRTIPIDDELRDLLLRWLAVHPGPLKSDTPLFVSLADKWGQRISAETIYEKIKNHSKRLGYWYGPYDDDNINPHYFRHWATSVIDERLEAASSGNTATTTKLLRGDEEDTMDNYTHWSDDRIKRYLEVCPKFYR